MHFSSDVDCPADACRWCLDQAKRGTDSIGFIPRPRFEADFAKGRVLIATENGDLVAFLLRGALRPTTVVSQCWTRRDARRVLYASALISALESTCRRAGVARIQLRCAADLPAVHFWAVLGFDLSRIERPRNVRRREVFTFVKDLPCLL